MHKLLTLISLFLVCCIVIGCQGDEASDAAGNADSTEVEEVVIPAMVTTDVSMLVSDSGIIRYHAQAPIWYRYDQKTRYWYFPQSIRLDQLDDNLESIGSLLSDTAYHFEDKRMWHLIGNVRVSNIKGERFNTDEIYWDMRQHTVYSDSFIHIERQHDILEGYGFTSNENFTEYELRQTTGIFEIHEQDNEIPDPDDDGEHLAENDEPGTISPDTLVIKTPLTPQQKAEAARQRRNRNGKPQDIQF